MMNRQGDRVVFEHIGPLVQRLDFLFQADSGGDPRTSAHAALADYLSRPGIREWLSGGVLIEDGPIRPLWLDPRGRFSILLYQWRPGSLTSIHDHWCWGAVAVIAGIEEEIRYALTGPGLAHQTSRHLLQPGDLTSFPAGTGGIHRVACSGTLPARSLHIYGGDLSRSGFSSIDQIYQESPTEVTPAIPAMR